MVRFIPLSALPTELETADLLFHQVFRQFGLPKDIVLDRGPQFTSQFWKEFLGKPNIMVSLMSGYHPQANGQVERVNQELGKFLRLYCNHHPETWSTYLPWAEYAQNWMRHTGTGLTSFECVLGYQLPVYPWNIPTSYQPSVDRWCWKSEQTWEETHQNLGRVIAAYKRKTDGKRGETPKYEIGQKVWVSTRDGRANTTGKLEESYEGPYSITGWINEITYRVGLAGSSWASWAFHVSSLKPVKEGPLAEEGDSSKDQCDTSVYESDKDSTALYYDDSTVMPTTDYLDYTFEYEVISHLNSIDYSMYEVLNRDGGKNSQQMTDGTNKCTLYTLNTQFCRGRIATPFPKGETLYLAISHYYPPP
ncbi:hypothetical protein P4O66_010143 [Electrophorus voltai]|uniref:Integrase catalytic domain-containing protein n=1 Tax=Electrophorus voltai TaxID=2609070 RepID=A0AAD9DUZ4_9TELE|nr:hypothetical protein P4O66_010143 [Electrophorus voltai]